MGFYGNITNTSRTQFQFDRVYSNRDQMEINMANDGIYAGRYVLIEYDEASGLDNYLEVYTDGEYLYTSPSCENITKLKIDNTNEGSGIIPGTIVRIKNNKGIYVFYKIEQGEIGSDANYTLVVDSDSVYQKNYNIDIAKYGQTIGRGFDSTVWQKVYVNKIEKYVMIAELNTVVPTFAISADAPTMSPIVPHFDSNSTNVYYQLHSQPQWGFRVKASDTQLKGPILKDNGTIDESAGEIYYTTANNEGKKYPSDTTTQWVRTEYDADTGLETTYYYNGTDWSGESSSEIPAAIYFNKAGFDHIIDTKFDGRDDIKITPTGQSGHVYNAHDSKVTKEPREDIQELSIMLPSIGNSISKMWDIVYGVGDVTNENKRNTNINWNNISGQRLVTTDESGYGYNPDKIQTLAGCINSAHDLMGMIIEVNDNVNAPDLDMDKIYYNNGKYYRRRKAYEYKNLEESDYIYEIKEVTENNYIPGYYYFKNGEIYEADGVNASYDSEKSYYVKKPQQINATEITVYQYEPSKYYRKNGFNYILAIETERNVDKLYYDLGQNLNGKTFDYSYSANNYYKLTSEDPKVYSIVSLEKPLSEETYYKIDINSTQIVETDKIVPFEASKYYIRENINNIDSYIKATEYTEGVQYYRQINNQNKIEYVAITLFDLNSKDYYYKEDNKYILTKTAVSGVNEYYILNFTSILGSNFYIPGEYWYLSNNDYIKDESNKAVNGRVYYKIDASIINYFYEPNTYYYKNNKEDITPIIDTNEKMTQNRLYYIYFKYYVVEDKGGVLEKGSAWNNNVSIIPSAVTLATRDIVYEAVELNGFGRHLNTLNGLILQVNKIIENSDYYHRDNDSVQGLLNQLKDLISNIGEMTPEDVIITDNYGRMRGAKLKSNDWIETSVDGNVLSPALNINHKVNEIKTIERARSENLNFGDSINLLSYDYDNAGHIVRKIITQEKLPILPILKINDIEDEKGKVITGLSINKQDNWNLIPNYSNLADIVVEEEKTLATIIEELRVQSGASDNSSILDRLNNIEERLAKIEESYISLNESNQ